MPARTDLAALRLKGRVEAARFVEGVPHRVAASLLDLTSTPDPAAGLATQLLFGEPFTVYEVRPDGLAWGQSERDGYVGYVAADGLGEARADGRPLTSLSGHRYASASLKARTLQELPFLADLDAGTQANGFTALRDGGFTPTPHLAPVPGDFVAQAERLLGAPYLWGGRSPRGLDCSALVQLALMATGFPAPRDSDMQAALLGSNPGDAPPRRGDLVFWRGHVGILLDAAMLIHANAHHMAVAVEPLSVAVTRIRAAGGGEITGRRRLATLPGPVGDMQDRT